MMKRNLLGFMTAAASLLVRDAPAQTIVPLPTYSLFSQEMLEFNRWMPEKETAFWIDRREDGQCVPVTGRSAQAEELKNYLHSDKITHGRTVSLQPVSIREARRAGITDYADAQAYCREHPACRPPLLQ